MVKAARQLGFSQVGLNALYRLGLLSGYFVLAIPVRSEPANLKGAPAQTLFSASAWQPGLDRTSTGTSPQPWKPCWQKPTRSQPGRSVFSGLHR